MCLASGHSVCVTHRSAGATLVCAAPLSPRAQGPPTPPPPSDPACPGRTLAWRIHLQSGNHRWGQDWIKVSLFFSIAATDTTTFDTIAFYSFLGLQFATRCTPRPMGFNCNCDRRFTLKQHIGHTQQFLTVHLFLPSLTCSCKSFSEHIWYRLHGQMTKATVFKDLIPYYPIK